DGAQVRYRVAGDDVMRAWLALRDAAAGQVADVERAARDYLGGDVEAIGRPELITRLRRGDVLVVDVRPRVEYDAGHIRGARSVPIDELERRLDELPAGVDIVAYCRGPYCVYAHQAVRRLTAAGRAARRLDTGWPEWRLAGAPAATGPDTAPPAARPRRRRTATSAPEGGPTR
ncbi:MAG: rhodanese-like domain-containing protein, partial [Actinomycetota bacterium]